jgi:uncharacterized protein
MYIVPENYDIKATIKCLMMRNKYINTTYSITISPTYDCNLSCGYCFQNNWKDKNIVIGDDEQSRLVKHVDHVLESTAYKKILIVWTGGEPLLRAEWISNTERKLVEVCQKHNADYSSKLITNLTMVNEDIIESISKMNVRNIQVTLDGYKDVHDSLRISRRYKSTYSLILSNLKIMISHFDRIQFNLRIHISRDTVGSISRLLDDLSEKGLRNKINVVFARVRSYGEKEIPLPEYAELEMKLYRNLIDRGWKIDVTKRLKPRVSGCAAYTAHAISLAPDLSAYKCWEMVQGGTHCIGEIDQNGKLTSNGIENVAISLDPFLREDCSTCSVLPLCMGGCAKQEVMSDDSQIHEQYQIGANCYSIRHNLLSTLKLHLYSMEAQAQEKPVGLNVMSNRCVRKTDVNT